VKSMAFVSTVAAITREPLLTWSAKVPKTHPMDYYVPNFGNDRDIEVTQQNLKESEDQLKKKWVVTAEQLKKPKDDSYTVPDFGVDADIKQTQRHLAGAESELGHSWNVVPKKDRPKPHPINYAVPNFGVDRDILDSRKNLADTERLLNHTWTPPTKKLEPLDLTKLARPDFGVDRDIAQTQRHMRSAEGSHRNANWNPEPFLNVQLQEHREPLLTWEPKVAKTHPMNYPVPNFGNDVDMDQTHRHLAESEDELKHKWNPQKDDDDKWKDMPREHIEFKLFESDPVSAFNFAQTKDNVNFVQLKSETDAETETERDPLLTWEPKPAKTHPMDYFVPNFGVDGNIASTFESLAVAEKITGHHWQWVDPKDRPKPPPVDYKVPNFGEDADIKMTQEEITAAEKKLNHKWNFVPKKERPKPHPVDYPVPSFGEDPEIKDTQESEVEAATQVWSDRLKA